MVYYRRRFALNPFKETGKPLKSLLTLLVLLCSSAIYAEPTTLRSFDSGSLKKITHQYSGKPFLLVLWSIDCPACYDELALLSPWLKKHSDVNLVLVSTDPKNQQGEVRQVINEYQLSHRENWIFGSQAHALLRQSIDPNWYGELPRSYLFDPQHKSYAHSGILSNPTLEKIAGIFYTPAQ